MSTKPKTGKVPSDALIAERLERYGHHLPTHPLRRTRVPGLLADEPEFRELEAERDAVRAAEARLDATHADWSARVAQQRTVHQEAQRRAMLDGSPPPPPLAAEPWPYAQHTRQTFDELHSAIEATELGLLEEHALQWARVLDDLSEPIRLALEKARRTVAGLESELASHETARDAVQRAAVSVSRWEERQGAPTAADRMAYVERVESGAEGARLMDAFIEATSPRRSSRRGRGR